MRPSFSWPRLAALALMLAGVVLVITLGADEPVKRWSEAWRPSPLARLWAWLAYWGGLGGTQATLLAALALLWGWWGRRPTHWRAGLAGVASVALSGILVQVCKHLFGRPRPRLALPSDEYFGPTFQSDLLSFPSGHATTSLAVAAALSVFYPRLAWLFYLLAALISLGRVVGNSHYLSDVLAGALLGLMVGWPLGQAVAAKAWRRP
ncbi:MAG: phosphatase PAP2 family protein [Desulfarculus sp.]|nr:phosphatase PAP2 family protein [Desulfarculus sp.]